ncbi:MAG TPA: TetR/AcrR family transcriptional regulator C-terminal domain-containing protein, partial [Rubrobacter sp.]|nr:TetR/AcrR family transcriptional regulator C-terminal domain-containing protein [Rubrobacter sp.]
QIARHALSTITNLVGGEPGVVVAREESEELIDARQRARHFMESLPPERYPRLVEAATPLSEGVDPDAYFSFGLDLLLAGIEAMAVRER